MGSVRTCRMDRTVLGTMQRDMDVITVAREATANLEEIFWDRRSEAVG